MSKIENNDNKIIEINDENIDENIKEERQELQTIKINNIERKVIKLDENNRSVLVEIPIINSYGNEEIITQWFKLED